MIVEKGYEARNTERRRKEQEWIDKQEKEAKKRREDEEKKKEQEKKKKEEQEREDYLFLILVGSHNLEPIMEEGPPPRPRWPIRYEVRVLPLP